MARLKITAANKILDLVPRSTYGLDKEVDAFLDQIHTELSDAVTRITRGEAKTASIQIKVEK